MNKRLVCFLFLFLFFSICFSQNPEGYFVLKKTTKEFINTEHKENTYHCKDISQYDYPFLSLIICTPDSISNTINSALVRDTTVVSFEFIASFYFSDSIDYCKIEKIRLDHYNLKDFYCQIEKEEKQLLCNEFFSDFLMKSDYYYTLEYPYKNFGLYYVFYIKIAPQRNKE